MPDDFKCPDCVVGDLQEMKIENNAYYFCDACGWSEWDDDDFFSSSDTRWRRDSDEIELESPDW